MNGITTSKHSWQSATRCVLGTVVAALLTACGGGGGGGGGNSDTTAPTVTAVTPLAGASEVALTDTVAVTFSEPVDCTTLTTARFTLVHAGNRAVSGEVACSGQGATFRPAAALADGVQFTATVKAGVKDAAGNALATDHVWTFNTRSRAWGTAQAIETDDAVSAMDGVVVGDASGNALTVWMQKDAAHHDRIWANAYVVGTGWGTAQPVDSGSQTTADPPRLAGDGAGNAIAVWAQYDDPSWNVWMNRHVAGSGWSGAELVETGDAGPSGMVDVAMDPNGNAVVAWSYLSGSAYEIWVRRYSAGSGWGAAQRLSIGTGAATYASVAMSGDGSAIVAWEQSTSGVSSVWASRYTTAEGWGTPQRLDSMVTSASDVKAAMDRDGNGIVVWTQWDDANTNLDLFASRFTPSSGFGGAEGVEQESGIAFGPDIAFDHLGNALLVWTHDVTTPDGTKRSHIRGNRYVAGSGWGEAQLLEQDETSDALYPMVAVDANGAALAVWRQADENHNLVANRYTADGWGTPAVVGSDVDFNSVPSVALSGNGDGTVVWMRNVAVASGSRTDVWAVRFE